MIGHARSADLQDWEIQPPLTEPGRGFGQLEVPQVEVVDGQPVPLFSCQLAEFSDARRAAGISSGVSAVPGASLLGLFRPGVGTAAH